MALTVVCGAGGFIGGHLVKTLLEQGERVRAIDIKRSHEWFQRFPGASNYVMDLRDPRNCTQAVKGATRVFQLACNMGGIGFIEQNKAACMQSVTIDAHMLEASSAAGVDRYYYASSACVYAADKQTDPAIAGLKESDAWPAQPEEGYGLEKLFSEEMCKFYTQDYGLQTRVARYHNCYGPNGSFDGGREKAPAAICRKVAHAVLSGTKEIEIWGDGTQTRSFLYIDDCIAGTLALMESDVSDPLNIGSEEKVSINQLVDIVEEIAGVKLERRYKLDAPKGVNGRNSCNDLVRARIGWDASTSLRDGMAKTYAWIFEQLSAR